MKDLLNNTKVMTSMHAHADTAGGGAIDPNVLVDRNGYESAVLEVFIGTISSTGGTYTIVCLESDDSTVGNGTVATAVTNDGNTVATFSAGPAIDKRILRLAYHGTKRWIGVRVTDAASGGTTNVVGGNVILGNPRFAGQTQFS